MKKLLIPINFSNESSTAFEIAREIIERNHQEIVLLHIIELPTHFIESGIFTNYNNLYDELFEDLKQKNSFLLEKKSKSVFFSTIGYQSQTVL